MRGHPMRDLSRNPHALSLLAKSFTTFALMLLFLAPRALAQGNGITVGQPKIYDNQSLTIMLDELKQRLLQANAVDPQALAKALGLIQGSQQQDVTRSFNITVSPTPNANPSSNASSPSSSASSSSASDNSTSGSGQSTSKKSSSSNSSSAIPELLSAPSYNPTYGENAIDLLSDQVDLTYQIFNLRMILERSLTDRYKDGSPRRQAIVSFNITLDPPANARDAAAYVEITLKADQGPLSLVAAMPQEKTYNATSLSSSSTAFGGAAVAKIISISYNQRKRSQTFFLYRDCDTLAIERAPVGNSVTFGWVFRPVLGRKSVSPGMRQMFAVIALPETDVRADDANENHGASSPSIAVHAITYWLHYDKNTSTTLRRPGFWDWSAKSLPPAEDFGLQKIQVLPTKTVEDSLKAHVDDVQVFPTTNGNTVLQISGGNFYSGTTVTIGDKTFSSSQDGLFIKSSQTILLTANSDLLSRSLSAVVNGRYGPAVPFYPNASSRGIVIAQSSLKPDGPSYSTVELIIANSDPTKDLRLSDIAGSPYPLLTLNGTQVPYTATLVPTHAKILDPKVAHDYIVATAPVPNSLLHPSNNRAGIIFPLLGQNWAPEDLIHDSDEVQVTKMTSGPTTTLLISRPGRAFNRGWQIVLDKAYPLTDAVPVPPAVPQPRKQVKPNQPKPSDAQLKDDKAKPAADKKNKGKEPTTSVLFAPVIPCAGQGAPPACAGQGAPPASPDCYILKLTADSKFLANYQKLILVSDLGHAQILDVPTASTKAKEAPPSTPPKIASISPATVGLNEVVTVTIIGSGLDGVKQVSFEGKSLTFWFVSNKQKGADSDSSTANDSAASKTGQMQVLLTREVTGKEGHQELLLQVDNKTMATASLTVAAAPTAAKGQTAPAQPPPASSPSTKEKRNP